MKAVSVIKKIQFKFKTKFEFGSAGHILYEAGGCSEDWARARAKTNHSYIIELKPSVDEVGNDSILGFDYPESLIESSSEEIYFGIKDYLLNFHRSTYTKQVENECKHIMKSMEVFHRIN
jgi:hypothetical protein